MSYQRSKNPPRVITFCYEPSPADPAFIIGAIDHINDLNYARSWRTRIAGWIVNKLLKAPESL